MITDEDRQAASAKARQVSSSTIMYPSTNYEIEALVEKGFLAGIEHARRWRKYPDEKPKLGDTVQLYSRFNHHVSIGWLDQCGDDESSQVFINDCGEVIPEVSHWQPIHLPEDEK